MGILWRVILVSVTVLLATGPAFAGDASSCNGNFNRDRVFKKHGPEMRLDLGFTLAGACTQGLSDSQIAGRVLKRCLSYCQAESSDKDCRQECLGTVQRMAKETQRLKKHKTASK